MYFDVNGCKVETSHMSKQHIKTPKHLAMGKIEEKKTNQIMPQREKECFKHFEWKHFNKYKLFWL